MAMMEVTVIIRGDPSYLKQALFIEDSDWDLTLTKFRPVIAKLDVPLEFQFLMPSANVVSKTLEDAILVRDIINQDSASSGEHSHHSDHDMTKELKEGDVGGNGLEGDGKPHSNSTPEIWLIPCSENKCASSVCHCQKNCATSGEGLSSSGNGSADGNNREQATDRQPLMHEGRECSELTNCPWKHFVQNVQLHANPRFLFKMVLILTVIMAVLMACLTFTLQVMLGALTSLSATPALKEVFASFKGQGFDADALANIHVKLKEMEMTTKYDIHELRTKLEELEDLYLRDLEVHRKELLMAHRQHVKSEAVYPENHGNAKNTKKDLNTKSDKNNMPKQTEKRKNEKKMGPDVKVGMDKIEL